ncbi:hypothetical protein [Altibacter lentus]|uniref:hypothetical protein n=1 Tax=Altibacter lentus TaxID=1223410 RepID=UPI00054E6F73|nr:hypothetical protein [Altibacter lentus]
MIRTVFYIIFFCSITSALTAQKMLQKEWDVAGIHSVILQSDVVYKVQILSEEINTINLITTIEGETFENVLIEATEEAGVLHLSTGYSPYFVPENDKLAAHKVLGIEMVLKVPKKLRVSLHSALASVKAVGTFTHLEVALEQGDCELLQFTGNATLQTLTGAIVVYATQGVSGTAVSKKGEVINLLPTTGDYKINAESRTGTIQLLQTK